MNPVITRFLPYQRVYPLLVMNLKVEFGTKKINKMNIVHFPSFIRRFIYKSIYFKLCHQNITVCSPSLWSLYAKTKYKYEKKQITTLKVMNFQTELIIIEDRTNYVYLEAYRRSARFDFRSTFEKPFSTYPILHSQLVCHLTN